MTEISAINVTGGAAGSGGTSTTVPSDGDLASMVVGLDVYNKANQDIGTIKDVAYDAQGVNAYIVGVGAFLGMGDHYVAVRPSALNVTCNVNDKKWHAAMHVNADQLKTAPECKYPSGT